MLMRSVNVVFTRVLCDHFDLLNLIFSAYVGGLWLAALYAAREMLLAARKVTSTPNLGCPEWPELKDDLESLVERAKKAYHKELWAGGSVLFNREAGFYKPEFDVPLPYSVV